MYIQNNTKIGFSQIYNINSMVNNNFNQTQAYLELKLQVAYKSFVVSNRLSSYNCSHLFLCGAPVVVQHLKHFVTTLNTQLMLKKLPPK